jgi:DNA polymerase-3 subunit delta'
LSWRIVGHERPAALLERALTSDQLSHAYLLSGPEGIGKRTLALELASAALCVGDSSDAAPCRACPSCARIETNNHPDFRLVELDAERVQISRQEIGRIQRDVALKPLVGTRKVYVLIEVERLSPVAGNQLLKLLEEPPPGVIFVLTTADVGAVLPTITSRCQVVRMQPVSRETIAAHLSADAGVDSEAARLIAEVADGRIGWAIRAGADPALLQGRESAMDDLLQLLQSERLDRLLKSQELAARWYSDRASVLDELDWWARALRDLAVQAAVPNAVSVASRGHEALSALSGQFSASASIEAARAAQHTALLLEQNVHPRIALDTLVIDLPTIHTR